MDPEHALLLFSNRLAQEQTGHMPLGGRTECGCETCSMLAQLTRANKPLQRAFAFIHYKATRRSHAKEARAVLSDLAHGTPYPSPVQISGNGEKSSNPFSPSVNPVVGSNVGTSTTTLEE